MLRKKIPVVIRALHIRSLFVGWAGLIALIGALVYRYIPTSEVAFYVIEGVIVWALIFLYYFYRKTVKPLRVIGDAMDLLQAQDFSSRLAPVGQYDADRIVLLFNRLMEQLKNERLHVREQNHFLDLLIGASPMGVILFDFDHRITGLNTAARRFLGGQTENEFMGRTLDEIPTPLALRLKRIPKGKTETVRLNDAMIYRCSSLSFFDQGFPHPFMLIESLTEVIMRTEKKTYEKVIRMIAHEVNNSMAGVTSTLDSLTDILGSEEGNTDLCTAMQVCSERCMGMNQFIGRLAEIVKLPDPQLKPFSLNKLIETCLLLMESQCRQRHIQLTTQLDDTDPQVNIDEALFEQVLINLVKNAAESIGENGEIRIRTSAHPPQLEVADNGPGISPENEEKLFTPFFSTKPTGQGIGLIYIREVLTKHACAFTLQTDTDGWTRFRIVFAQVMH